jgi:hypothetical protein
MLCCPRATERVQSDTRGRADPLRCSMVLLCRTAQTGVPVPQNPCVLLRLRPHLSKLTHGLALKTTRCHPPSRARWSIQSDFRVDLDKCGAQTLLSVPAGVSCPAPLRRRHVLFVDLDERVLPQAIDVGLVVALPGVFAGILAELVFYRLERRYLGREAGLHLQDVPAGL